ncbi:RecX family transcriptional regulator [Acetobacter orleanensis]|uniref:Regulatory protein RecX n=1 Tax=Acetobacter orleanensis TaxID=104099 RepID=A0A4Y3TJB4_9PROT|nr:RecX family transcriptional regulator [Acetobacter orleanensis]KXV62878.1 recombinase RecA [Acetobacter orleanensis]PCD80654.1 recombinase RecA [Acetobacter orleanensis]GAN68006.1 RecA repressor protein RecX [Acetobacter orleanensis JCM 7639]GBR27365.1 recombinase A [Acetobacter orleanensis NRIC 0473]GEB82072.1 recombinase RecX [Acetobacter orleanensis]
MGSETTPAAEAPPPPDRKILREAALAHLARFATTRQGLEQVLLRRIARWERSALKAGVEQDDVRAKAAALRPVVEAVAEEMIRLGAVDDAAFAQARARRLVRSGRSGRAVQAHLAARGVEADVREAALQEVVEGFSPADVELSSALVLARKRRLGPFAGAPSLRPPRVSGMQESGAQDFGAQDDGDGRSPGLSPEEAEQRRAMGIFARAGFGRDVAQRVLEMDPEEAQEWMERLRAES